MIGRISPHLHHDLSCVAVPPLHEPSDDCNHTDNIDGAIISGGSNGGAGSISCNSFNANIFGSLRRCRSDSSEATLNPDDDEAASASASASACDDEMRSAAARRRQQVQQAAAASSGGGSSNNSASNANVSVSDSARPNMEPPPWAVEAKGEHPESVLLAIGDGIVIWSTLVWSRAYFDTPLAWHQLI